MSLISENIIPGTQGKVFTTNASDKKQLVYIQNLVLELSGIKDVIIDDKVFPMEFTVHTTKLVPVSEIEKAVNKTGVHAIQKSVFPL